MKLPEAMLGFRYYEKLYTGTTSGNPYYGISFVDSIFTPTEFVSTDGGWINYSGTAWNNTQGITSGVQTQFYSEVTATGGITFLMATYYSGYGTKPYKILIKYKLTL